MYISNFSTRVLVSILLSLFATACAKNNYYYEEIEIELDTNGRVVSQHHIAAYYPSGISLNFPGYVIGLEDSSPGRVTYEGDLIIDELAEHGKSIARIANSMRVRYLPFVSHVHRYEGNHYGEGNCALYSIYRNSHRSIVPFCANANDFASQVFEDPQSAYRNSWKAIEIIKEELAREIKTGGYSHMIIAMMGLDTSQEESIRNFKSIAWSIRQTAGEDFKPLFIGITWPSFLDGRWMDPVWETIAYRFKADEADRLGVSWLGVLMHEVIIPLSDQISTNIIAHSFGARALSMATCIGPAISNGGNALSRATGRIDKLIGLGAAFSLERLRDKKIMFYEDINYPNACDRVKTLVITATDYDTALKLVIWADHAGNYKYYKRYCSSLDFPYSISCGVADSEGNIEIPYEVAPRMFYVDTTELMRYEISGTQGGAHSDIFRPEIGRMLWTLLQDGK
jgi:hypothetical protein